ncbi:bifunctional 4-hydroxy-2-oxoglutarate aldolase/2-dehydro-3-deoxy-phosphogluconate aldolase [Agromyces sp. Root81]|uniref:bifunctional 4-hydroxy-2-oxoglutarate aldolase/2-dehydro-3-deoxy-phosphogluconate aldolase n=1 Tax=Agromyces sp. Root81 TaxID=1736601 RepID=UPI0009E8C135|nr:bifunctional 4-hydroxy-2-oxoglutarate aldolase/2-dehydro-3-deoxy-phosphogluconate aldolase [Agromyces sp. Root81]
MSSAEAATAGGGLNVGEPALADAAIVRQGAVPVLRDSDADRVHARAERLIEAGLTVIELTATTPEWPELLRTLTTQFPAATIGVGTITTPDDVATACEGGARFLVSPFPAESARVASSAAGTLFVGGGFTPAEISASSGSGLCKLFPAHLGGVAYLKTLTAILPGARIMPTGGIAVTEVSDWLRAGAVAVGVGSDLSNAPDLDSAVAELAKQVAEGRRR